MSVSSFRGEEDGGIPHQRELQVVIRLLTYSFRVWFEGMVKNMKG